MLRVLTIVLTLLILALVFLYQPILLSPGRPKATPTPRPPAGHTRPAPSSIQPGPDLTLFKPTEPRKTTLLRASMVDPGSIRLTFP